MNEVVLLYLFTRLDAIGTFLFLVSFVAFMASIALIGIALSSASQDPDDWTSPDFKRKAAKQLAMAPVFRRRAIIAGCVGLVAALLTVATPSQKDMAIIVGGKLAIDAAKSEKGQELAGAVYDAVMAQLKKASK